MVGTCGTFYYETAKFLASYLLPLTENEYSIKTVTDFAERLSNRTDDDDEVLVSYDVSSLFTEVPLDETTVEENPDHFLDTAFRNWNQYQQVQLQRLQETGETTNTLEIWGPYQVEKELHQFALG